MKKYSLAEILLKIAIDEKPEWIHYKLYLVLYLKKRVDNGSNFTNTFN